MFSQIFLLLSIACATIHCHTLKTSEIFHPVSVENSNTRITNGAIARPGEFPWHAVIYVRQANNWIFCAGALVSNQAVVTEADCLIHGTEVRVVLGNTLFGKGKQVIANGVALHPKHHTENRSYNLAVIRLSEKVPFGQFVQPVHLPPISFEHYQFANQIVRLTGHGSKSK